MRVTRDESGQALILLIGAMAALVLGAWRALRQAIDPLIVAGGGRIFKALGDGLLFEFPAFQMIFPERKRTLVHGESGR